MDYVYHESANDELKSVHVQLYPNSSGEYFDLKFTSDSEISPGDLEIILNSLWAEWFTRLRINPVVDCKIILVTADATYDVGIAALPKISVTGLKLRRI